MAEDDVTLDPTGAFFVRANEVAKEQEAEKKAPEYSTKAWICLRRDTFPRKQCIGIISNKWFDRIILSLIGINCVTMALFASPLIKNMLEGECDGEDTFSKPVHGFTTCTDLINSRSQWAVQHWTFGVLKPQKGCSLNDAAPCSIAQTIDFFFLIVFTIEMLIKMLAQGLLMHKNAYLRQGWNWLDFVVVIVGYVEMFASALPGIKAIRLVKALRPLRSLQRIRGLRVLVQCILEALPQMLNVAVFLIFMIVIFGLFGHAFFKGTLRHTCHACDQWDSDYTVCLGEWSSTGDTCDAECSWDEDANGIKLKKCDALGNGTWQMEMGKWPGKWTYSCRARERCLCTSMDKSNVRVEPKWGKASTTDVRMRVETGAGWSDGITFSSAAEDTKNRKPWIKSGASVYGYPVAAVDAAACDYLSNPNYGITSFDSLPWAMVSLFQAISLEGWVDMMYQLMDGYGMWVVIYFILLVLVGAIIVMNLFLAVLCDNFEMADDAATEDGLPEEPIEDAEEVMEREMKLLAHENKYRQMCLELIKIKRFDMFIQGCILFNTLLMCLKWAPGPTNNLEASVSGDPTWGYLETWHGVLMMVLNILLTTIFTAESIIKVVALGPKLFRRDPMNVFDAFVVVFSIVEIGLDLNTKASPGSFTLPVPLSVLRAFRVFRLFKLVRSVESMRKILSTLVSSLASVVYLALLLCLVILIFILLGMELFGGRYPHAELNYTRDNFPYSFEAVKLNWDDQDFGSRYHFDDFGTALLAIFVVLSGENWNEIMFDSHRASWDDTGAFAIVYFIVLFVVGNLLLFNLFIAILLSNFDNDEEEGVKRAEGRKWRSVGENMPAKPDGIRRLNCKELEDELVKKLAERQLTPEDQKKSSVVLEFTHDEWDGLFKKVAEFLKKTYPEDKEVTEGREQDEEAWCIHETDFVYVGQLPDGQYFQPADPVDDQLNAPRMMYRFGKYVAMDREHESRKSAADFGDEEEVAEVDKPKDYPDVAAGDEHGDDKSLGYFGWDSKVRVFCARTILNKYFEPVILVLILVSTLFLVIDMPHFSERHPLRVTMYAFNIIFTVLFTVEMCLKIVALGFINSKTPKKYNLSTAYLRDGWNILDFFIVFVSILALTLPKSIKGVKQLRAFRAIRPMRLVSRYEALKITFQTLLKSIPSMASLMSVASLFFIIFAILGLELFGGKLGYCKDPEHDDAPRLIVGMNVTKLPDGSTITQNDYEECMSLSRYNITRRTTDGIELTDMADIKRDRAWLEYTEFPQWMYPQFGTFDNVGMSLMLLFEVSALEGWPDVMHKAMDTDSQELFIEAYRVDSNPLDWLKPSDWTASTDRPRLDVITAHEHTTSNIEAGIFFILWIILGCFVIVNMTVGVVVDTFAEIKEENDGVLLMTDEETEWVQAQKQVLASRPLRQAEPPPAPWRRKVYDMINGTKFEVTIMSVIMLNVLQMSSDWFEPHPDAAAYNPALKTAMQYINFVFYAIYLIEMGLKWVGLGVPQYFKNSWNCFDFFLVLVSTVDIIFSSQEGELPFPVSVLRTLRILRVARILRIIKTAKSLRTIVMTVFISVPQLKNILVLIILIILITDMLLVGFFFYVNYTPNNFEQSKEYYRDSWESDGGITYPTPPVWVSNSTGLTAPQTPLYKGRANMLYGEPYTGEIYRIDDFFYSGTTNWGDAINRHANFGTFWMGLLTLVRSSTGESFNGLMHDLMGPEWGHNRLSCCLQCGPVLDGKWEDLDLSHLPAADIFRITNSTDNTLLRRIVPDESCGHSALAWSIYLIFQMVMAYIVLSIMIGVILENFSNVGSESKKISMEDIEDFREVWLKYDPKGSFIVPSHNLLAILQQLKEPLGIQGKVPALTRADMLKHLGELDIPDHQGYVHFMEVLTACANKKAGEPLPVCDTTNKLDRSVQAVPKLKALESAQHSALTNYLVSLLQSRFRGFEARKSDGTAGNGAELGMGGGLGKVKAGQVAPE